MAASRDADHPRRFAPPYSAQHPVPTISRYREEKEARQEEALQSDSSIVGSLPGQGSYGGSQSMPATVDGEHHGDHASQLHGQPQPQPQQPNQQLPELPGEDDTTIGDTSQIDPAVTDPRQRMQSKHKMWERAERVVTDPVTHLPVTIRDFSDDALREVDIDGACPWPSGTQHLSSGSGGGSTNHSLHRDTGKLEQEHKELSYRFPPPDYDSLRQQLAHATSRGLSISLAGTLSLLSGALVVGQILRRGDGSLSTLSNLASLAFLSASVGAACLLTRGVKGWVSNRFRTIFDDELWNAQRKELQSNADKHEKETTVWLNSLIGSVWPIMNPDMFAGVGDTLEDVMQASLPTIVRMVSVDDIGQGSEAIRILGVRWLPAGAAAESVSHSGRGTPDDGSPSGQDGSGQVGDEETLKAEEGEFINLEVAFAYRSRTGSESMHARAKDIHLSLAFYLPGNIKFPVWVDLKGIVGIMRVRLQLTPDPPFFELCTLTFLGQPKVDLSCIPLTRDGLNIMDVPFISSFVQSSIDAAMSQYVAPRSLTLNLKDMLAGEDFKKDTDAKGVLMVKIKRAYGFRMGDSGIPLLKEGSSDPYVSVGWAKFGKALWSTRIMTSEMEPRWDETCFILVTPDELSVDERLRLQLWDSDRTNADDDLGRIEVDLKAIMKDDESNGRISDRVDDFKDLQPGGHMLGQLEWSVGYFPKAGIQGCQFEQQTHDPEIRSMDQLKAKVNETSERKLREAAAKNGRDSRREGELIQLKAQGLKEAEDAMIISAPPPQDHPSGILSIQIHNITGLELSRKNKDPSATMEEPADEAETGGGLPSAYCTIIINHRKTYKTRTKPQNSKPFYNAGCERFIGDWRECEAYVSVRDSRLTEEDPLLGMVHLPLYEVFRERSQVMETWPLAGGVGHGKIRISLVWRSVALQAPRNLIGWDCGTVVVQPTATSAGLDGSLQSSKLELRTEIGRGKMYASKGEHSWRTKRNQPLRMPVIRRYASCMSISFRSSKTFFGDNASAFCILWLKDLVDDEEQEVELDVWKGDFKRATMNVMDEAGERVGTIKLKLTFCAGLVR